jgi:hypothetical protein
VQKCDGNRTFGRTRRGWKYNIKLDLEDLGIRRGHGLIYLAEDRYRRREIVNAVMKLRVR